MHLHIPSRVCPSRLLSLPRVLIFLSPWEPLSLSLCSLRLTLSLTPTRRPRGARVKVTVLACETKKRKLREKTRAHFTTRTSSYETTAVFEVGGVTHRQVPVLALPMTSAHNNGHPCPTSLKLATHSAAAAATAAAAALGASGLIVRGPSLEATNTGHDAQLLVAAPEDQLPRAQAQPAGHEALVQRGRALVGDHLLPAI